MVMIIMFFLIFQCTFLDQPLSCLDSNQQNDIMLKSPIIMDNNDYGSNQNRSKLQSQFQTKTKTNNNDVFEQYIPKALLANLKEKEKIELASMAILTAPNEVQLMDQHVFQQQQPKRPSSKPGMFSSTSSSTITKWTSNSSNNKINLRSTLEQPQSSPFHSMSTASFEPKFSHVGSPTSMMGPSSNIHSDRRLILITSTPVMFKTNAKLSKISDESLIQSRTQSSLLSKSLITEKKSKERSKIQSYCSQPRNKNDKSNDYKGKLIGIPMKTRVVSKQHPKESNVEDSYKSKNYSSNINNISHHSRPLTSALTYRSSQPRIASNQSSNNSNNDSKIEWTNIR